MTMLDALAERRIREALERGEFDDLPGAGKPLALDDEPLVPEDLRAAYRVLRNAGFVPPELESRREIRALEQLLAAIPDADGRGRVLARINVLLARRPGTNLAVEQDYFEKIVERMVARRTA